MPHLRTRSAPTPSPPCACPQQAPPPWAFGCDLNCCCFSSLLCASVPRSSRGLSMAASSRTASCWAARCAGPEGCCCLLRLRLGMPASRAALPKQCHACFHTDGLPSTLPSSEPAPSSSPLLLCLLLLLPYADCRDAWLLLPRRVRPGRLCGGRGQEGAELWGGGCSALLSRRSH